MISSDKGDFQKKDGLEEKISSLSDSDKDKLYEIVELLVDSPGLFHHHDSDDLVFGTSDSAIDRKSYLPLHEIIKKGSPSVEKKAVQYYGYEDEHKGEKYFAEIIERVEMIRCEIRDFKDYVGDSLLSAAKEAAVQNQTIKNIGSEMRERLVPSSFNIDVNDYPVSRYIPVNVYLDEYDDGLNDVRRSIEELVKGFGFDFCDDLGEEINSWWARFRAKSVDAMTSDAVQDRMKKLERSIELKLLDKEQSEANLKNSEAVSKLIESIKPYKNAAVQVGSILVVKLTDEGGKENIIVRMLTNREMIVLESNQALLQSPSDLMLSLQRLSGIESNVKNIR